jgi:hypothetical protein
MTADWLLNSWNLRRARGAAGRRAMRLCYFEYLTTGVLQMLLAFVCTFLIFPVGGLLLSMLTPQDSLLRDYGPLGIFCACAVTAVIALARYIRWLVQRQITVIENNTRALALNTALLSRLEKRALCVHLVERKDAEHGSNSSEN